MNRYNEGLVCVKRILALGQYLVSMDDFPPAWTSFYPNAEMSRLILFMFGTSTRRQWCIQSRNWPCANISTTFAHVIDKHLHEMLPSSALLYCFEKTNKEVSLCPCYNVLQLTVTQRRSWQHCARNKKRNKLPAPDLRSPWAPPAGGSLWCILQRGWSSTLKPTRMRY